MIKTLSLVFLICICGTVQAQKKVDTIVGKWKGTDARTQNAGIEFLSDGTAKLLVMGMPYAIDQYVVDASKDPMQIKLNVKRNGQQITLYGLMQFIDTNSIKWEVFPMAQKQPEAFSPNATDTSVILKRQ